MTGFAGKCAGSPKKIPLFSMHRFWPAKAFTNLYSFETGVIKGLDTTKFGIVFFPAAVSLRLGGRRPSTKP
jgi:hypothetical protein